MAAKAGRGSASAKRPARPLAGAGLRTVPIPTPFPVGRVNAYLLLGEAPALIDCGPNSARSLLELERTVAQHGVGLAEIRYLLLTHQHVDHLGLAEAVVARSGAQVVVSKPLAAYLARGTSSLLAEQEFVERLMAQHGVAREVVLALRPSGAAIRAWGSLPKPDLVLDDGEQLTIGERTLEVGLVPGHSPSDTVFYEPQHNLLFGGDHLLAEISSNPLITPDPAAGADQERPRSLPTYLRSLARTAARGKVTVLPGHGDPIVDPVALVKARLRFHRRRARKVLQILERDAPLSAHQVARAIWGELALAQAFLTLSEVLGHLDLLEEEGLVEWRREGGLFRYRPRRRSSS